MVHGLPITVEADDSMSMLQPPAAETKAVNNVSELRLPIWDESFYAKRAGGLKKNRDLVKCVIKPRTVSIS